MTRDELTPTQRQVLDEVFVKAGYPSSNLKAHGLTPVHGPTMSRILESTVAGNVERAIEMLARQRAKARQVVGDLRAPALANVIAQSRPLEEWDVVRFSCAVQRAVYALSYEDFKKLRRVMEKPQQRPVRAALEKLGCIEAVDLLDQDSVNAILGAAGNIYEGCLVKFVNRAKKRLIKERKEQLWAAYHQEIRPDDDAEIRAVRKDAIYSSLREFQKELEASLRERDPLEIPGLRESVFIEAEGALHLKDPPGVNRTVQLVHASSLRPLNLQKDADILALLPGLKVENPDVRILSKAELLYNDPRRVRGRDHATSRRRKMRNLGGVGGPIPCRLRIGNDWIVADVRGLLRQAKRWFPKYRSKSPSLKELIALFTTGGAVFYNQKERRLQVKMLFLSQSLPVTMKDPQQPSSKRIEKMIESGERAVIVAADVGVKNPLVAKLLPVSKTAPTFEESPAFVPGNGNGLLLRIQERYTSLEATLRQQAFQSLSSDVQRQVAEYAEALPEAAKTRVRELLGDFVTQEAWEAIPWDQMDSRSCFISKAAGLGKEDWVLDIRCAWDARNEVEKLSEFARKAFNEALFAAKRESVEYGRLSVYVRNEAQRTVNEMLSWAREKAPGAQIVVAIEDLVMNSKFADGKGRRKQGWVNFFRPKEDRRWFKFAGVHRALKDLARDKGLAIVMSCPKYTSQRCPRCGHIDADNRPSQAEFLCRKCGFEAHADEVGAFNIGTVAYTGKALKKPMGERCGGAASPRVARKGKTEKNRGSMIQASQTGPANDNREPDRSQDGAQQTDVTAELEAAV